VQHVVDTFNAEIGSRYAGGAASVDELLAGQRQLTEPGKTGSTGTERP
jgi:hypothetical protein